ncbi:MAG: 3-keto-disaccharide hydrolase [Planctomycetota bacterium]|jgi:hypothetical protein
MHQILAALLLGLVLNACHIPPSLHGNPASAWFLIGDATFTREPGDVIHGLGRDLPSNSFLISMAEYADFELEVDVRIEGGNSGIQIRSRVDESMDHVIGYQIEIDPSDRAWSGGLYDERRRGWLDSNEGKPESRSAFRVGEWNRFRILCEGDHLRSWVNGIPCADFRDDADASGHIALQVHGGAKTDVWWRDLRITRLN